jgi:capsid protein (F protein)
VRGHLMRGGGQGDVTRSGHMFSMVPRAEIERSTFDRSFAHKTTMNAGFLVPLFVDEALPGDTFAVDATLFLRLATPIFPLMDNMYVDTHFFAVPYRLLWSHWANFNGEQVNPGDSTSFLIPQVTFTNAQILAGTLANYMGIGRAVTGTVPQPVNALFFRAYNLVYNSWYRDQNLISSANVNVGDGPDTNTDYVLRRRGKRHDYFTSCLPFLQKGTAQSVPLGISAPVVADGTITPLMAHGADTMMTLRGVLSTQGMQFGTDADPGAAALPGSTGPLHWGRTGLKADLTSATAATINQLRQAFQIQKLLERDARGGTRLIEIIRAHFNVVSPDARMQRPEYLGGGSSPVLISAIPQMSATAAGVTPQGNLAAVGVAIANRHGFTKSFTEHCVILGIVSVRADLTYQQGVSRMWKRQTRYDHYWPALAHIGEQAVLQGEIYADGNAANEAVVFGYAERFAEYRYKPSLITGQLQSTDAAPLDAWHLSQNFAAAPVLNQTFIEETPPVSRVTAVSTAPHFIVDSFWKMHCARPMPVYGVPGLIDHF